MSIPVQRVQPNLLSSVIGNPLSRLCPISNWGVARAGNVIGGGDRAKDRIIVDCVKAFSRNEVVEIRSPKATRPWQHVLEPIERLSQSWTIPL